MNPNLSDITQKWVELLIPFTRNYKKRLTATKLAELTKIPQQSSSRYLEKLVKLNLIEYEKEGRNKLFYFNLEKQTTNILLNILENQKALFLKLKERKISIIIDEILDETESIIIFGSYAKNTHHQNSDLDLLILGDCNKKNIKKIKERYTIEINEHYSSYVDFIKKIKEKNPLTIEIFKDHILFGDINKMIKIFREVNL